MKSLLFIICLFAFTKAYTQNTFQAVIKDGHTKEPLIGATALVVGTTNGASTDLGGFAQNTWDMNSKLAMESGFRTDYNANYGTFVLPRISLLFKPNKKLSGRLGGGMGYKLPTILYRGSRSPHLSKYLSG